MNKILFKIFPVVMFFFPIWLPILWVVIDDMLSLSKSMAEMMINTTTIACYFFIFFYIIGIRTEDGLILNSKDGGGKRFFYLIGYTAIWIIPMFFLGWWALVQIFGP